MRIVKVDINQKTILKNFMTLFLHDLSEFNEELDINPENGLFEFDVLEWFFDKEGLAPYFIVHEHQTIGFILLQSAPFVNLERYDFLVNSFFILKKYRRKGLGKQAAQQVFEQFPGRYAIGQLSGNQPAIAFWRSVYRFMKIEFEEKEVLEEGTKTLYQYFSV